MRVVLPSMLAGLGLALLAGCADDVPPTAPALPDEPALVLTTDDGTIELRRPRIDVTGWTDDTELLSLDLVVPESATGIGPGSAILITIPGEGRFGCTANFIWSQGLQYYLGSAGHCFLASTARATHGEGADYDASGVTVQVCIEGCEGNFRSSLLVGKWVTLGKVAYARQTDATGDEQIGYDFGVVEIPAAANHLIRTSMPVWGGPNGVQDELETGDLACHYGNGLVVGETVLTKARVGVGGGSDETYWMGDFAGAFGDSGSALNGCVSDELGNIQGTGAVGVLTHLGLSACPCDVKFKNLKVKAEHGVIFGTTIAQAKAMAREAGLQLDLVLE